MKRNPRQALVAAEAFVRRQGSPVELERLDGLLTGERAKGAAQAWEKLMHDSGGVPLGRQPGNPPAIDTTLYALSMAWDQRIHGSAAASRMLAFLRREQGADGLWRERHVPPAQLPPWTHPENPQSTLYLTSGAAFWLSLLQPEHTDPLRLAAVALEQAVTDEALRQADPRLLAQVAAFGWRYQGPESELCRRAFGALTGWLSAPGTWRARYGLIARRRGHLSAGLLAWCLSCCLLVAMGGTYTTVIQAALAELTRRQLDDGAWGAADTAAGSGSGESPAGDVEATLTALRVLLGYGWL